MTSMPLTTEIFAATFELITAVPLPLTVSDPPPWVSIPSETVWVVPEAGASVIPAAHATVIKLESDGT